MTAVIAHLAPPAIVRAAEDLCRCRHCLHAARLFPHDPPQLRLPLRERAQPGQLVDLAKRRAAATKKGRTPASAAPPDHSNPTKENARV